MRSTGRRKTDGSRRSFTARRNLLLDPQDLREGGAGDVKLLGRRLARAEDALDLVTRQPQQPRERAVGVAVRPGEDLDGEGDAAEPDDGGGNGALQAGAANPDAAGGRAGDERRDEVRAATLVLLVHVDGL